jgi:hypothetical protein
MELVRFTDRDGREWEVWEVGVRPALADHPPPPPTRGPERWLCFESGTERRRLLSYPTRWPSMPPQELDALCRAASPRPVVPIAPPRPEPEERRPP